MQRLELLKQIEELYLDGFAVMRQEELRRVEARSAEAATEKTKSSAAKKASAKIGSAKAPKAIDQPAPAQTASPQEEKKNTRLVGILAIDYQNWYSKALSVIRTVLPERLTEFEEQYRATKRKEIDYLTYTISDFLLGLSVTRGGEEVLNPYVAFTTKFVHQLTILYSALDRASSSLSNIEGILQYELFEGEIAAAEDLLRKGHRRAAGALVGVTLEAHLAKVAETRGVKVAKKSPTIADLNDPLRAANVIDLPMWRLIQRLADIRNLCAHSKDREPTADEVTDLIAGIKKVIGEVN